MQKFVIVAPPRSGSTFLRMALARHPQIVCHGEIMGARVLGLFHPGSDPEDQRYVRARSIERFSTDLVYARDADAVGLKILYQQMLMPHAAQFVRDMIEDTDVKVIYLWRRNLFARFLSDYRNIRRSIFRFQQEKAGEGERYAIEPDRVVQDARNQIASARVVLDLLRDHEHIAVELEQFENTGAAFDPLCEFLGVPTGQIDLDADFKPKAAPAKFDISDLIVNHDELSRMDSLQPYMDFPWSQVLTDR